MATCGRFCVGNLQQPAIAFLLGMGVLSIFYSLIIINIIYPAYPSARTRSLAGIYASEGNAGDRRSQYSEQQDTKTKERSPPEPIIMYEGSEEEIDPDYEVQLQAFQNVTDFDRTLRIINESADTWLDFQYFTDRVQNETFITAELPVQVLKRMSDEVAKLDTWIKVPKGKPPNQERFVKIYVATIVCGGRRHEASIMLKSLLLFTQDATFHLIVFSDNDTILDVGQDLLATKWLAQRKLGLDFSFELHREHFPSDTGTDWKSMYRTCATQRLFFPGLLPHIDSLIYLDTDTIVVSSMLEFWQQFKAQMSKQEMVGVAANNEDSANGWYGSWLRIPYVGKRGLNAGVMLMNLTRLRQFNFEERALATNRLFKERIKLADQDIVNIMFSAFPEYVFTLNCTYNFNWVHCGSNSYKCRNDRDENVCFCKAAHEQGIRVVHGNSGTFHSEDKEHIFISQLYKAFTTFNLLTDSPVTMFDHLKTKFDELPRAPCKPLTSDILYKNAEGYLKNIASMA